MVTTLFKNGYPKFGVYYETMHFAKFLAAKLMKIITNIAPEFAACTH
jgi:hypothetical protein